MTAPSRWETGLPALVLAAAALLGGAAGLLIASHAAAVVLASTLVQLGATALGWRLGGRSAVMPGVVAVVTLGIALEPTLRELLRLGAVPWAVLALTAGAVLLVGSGRGGWTVRHTLAAVAGAVATYCWAGFMIQFGVHGYSTFGLMGQIVCVGAAAGLVALAWRRSAVTAASRSGAVSPA
ncbi:hypothetical protein MRI28_18220 [Nocardiopsis dassonvillei]|uniref:hypothetical protein n=1 Tax=Nocardiopsis dassonvillei TaxID=2014 RepID=UPI00200EC465|nr:hypothetical protein [Nocardiopsis dassonvillei]MCK9871547.1 hypothetical protein [Nocardiopsis dassonvillei]